MDIVDVQRGMVRSGPGLLRLTGSTSERNLVARSLLCAVQ